MALKFIGDIDVLGSHNLVAADIPSLDASKITGGTFNAARIPDLSTSYLGVSSKAADSNLLDGIDSSSFLRSDQSDSASGNLTLSGGANISGGVQGSNSLMHSFFLPQNPEGSHVKAPWFFNDMAYARLRGATVTVTVNGGSSPSSGNIDAMLDASTGFWNMVTSGVTSVVIEMTNLPKIMYYGSHYGVTFGNTTWRAKDVKIETYYSGAWQTVEDVTNQSQEFVYGTKNSSSNGQTKLRWTFSNFNTTSMRIVSLFAYNYNAVGMPSLYLTKDGGEMFGDIDMGTNIISDTKVGQWDTAYGWGDHLGLYTGVNAHAPVSVSADGSNIFNITLSSGYNFSLSASSNWRMTVSISDDDVGKSGSFIITNSGTTSPQALPSNLKTPNGDSIAWQTDSGDISILSYFVVSTSVVLVNYIGNFG